MIQNETHVYLINKYMAVGNISVSEFMYRERE